MGSEKLLTILKWVYSLSVLIIPIYSVIFLHTNPGALEIMSAKNLDFLQSSYFLVVIFILFMLVLLHEYLPSSLLGMSELVFTPVIIIALQALVSPVSASEYLAQLGMLHVITVMLSFIILILYILVVAIVGNMFSSSLYDESILGLLVTCGAQLLFIIPGAGAIYIFGKYIYMHEILASSPTGSLWHWSSVILIGCYTFSIVNATRLFGRNLKNESIAA